MTKSQPQPIYLKDYKPHPYRVENLELLFQLEPTATEVRSVMQMSPNPASTEENQPLVLNGEAITLKEVLINGAAHTDYEEKDNKLTLHNVPQEAFELRITSLCNPEANKELSGLYRSGATYCTQCEAEGFRRITYSIDRPDMLTKFRVRIEGDKATNPVMLSNGNLIDSGDLDGNRHYAVWEDPFFKPTYLFALVAGDLALVEDNFTTRSGKNVPLRFYVEHGKENRVPWALDSLKKAMKWDEDRFGLEYDLDLFMIVAVSDFNSGAMENKGLNIFNDKAALVSPETATDTDYVWVQKVIGHEYFHNWTGDRVTCRDWFQLCLKEGLTVFRDHEFTADMQNRPIYLIQNVSMLRSTQFEEDAGPLAHPPRPDSFIEIRNFYTRTVYDKGAEVCRMLQTILGVDGFRKGMDLYFERHDGQAVTVEDFVAAMADANGRDLTQFLLWYTQAGTPEVTCNFAYDAAARTATLKLSQHTAPTPGESVKPPRHIPFAFGMLDAQGRDIPLKLADGTPVTDGVLHLTDAEATFVFTDVPEEPVPSYLRSFSAPVKVNAPVNKTHLLHRMAHDADEFNRWEAGQIYGTQVITDMLAAHQQGSTVTVDEAYIEALRATLLDESLLPHYRAAVLGLPSHKDIALKLAKNLDHAAIHAARKEVRRQIAAALADDLLAVYTRHKPAGAYTPSAEAIGQRALRGATLAFLAATPDDKALERVYTHYTEADNMTDTMAALRILTNEDTPYREQAFADFYGKWQNDHMVLDKWFSLQAMSTLPGALDRVKNLTQHEKFTLKNPNRLRSVLSVFSNLNYVHFNAPDGEGFRFFTDIVLEVDSFNSQMSSRLLGAMESWRTLEPEAQAKAQEQLERIAAHEGLSVDLFEIVSKILA